MRLIRIAIYTARFLQGGPQVEFSGVRIAYCVGCATRSCGAERELRVGLSPTTIGRRGAPPEPAARHVGPDLVCHWEGTAPPSGGPLFYTDNPTCASRTHPSRDVSGAYV